MAFKDQLEIVKNGAKYQAVKNHVDANKKLYVGFGLGVLVGVAIRKPINVTTNLSPTFLVAH